MKNPTEAFYPKESFEKKNSSENSENSLSSNLFQIPAAETLMAIPLKEAEQSPKAKLKERLINYGKNRMPLMRNIQN